MKIEIQLFAIARQVAGRANITIELADEATVADLRRRLGEACPALTPLLPAMMFAVENNYLGDSQELPRGGTLACIPPVSGG